MLNLVRSRRRMVQAVAAVAAGLALALTTGATAQQPDPRLAPAQAKGKVSWYAAIFPDELRKELTDAFKANTGIEVNSYIGGTGQVFSRFVTERKTGSYAVDVLTISDVDLVEDLVKDGALVSFRAPGSANLAPAYRDPGDFRHTIAFWGCALEYNTRLLKKDRGPKAWSELADPQWKSKVAINDPARSALGFLMLKVMVHEHGWEWFERLMRNDPLVIAVGPGIDQAVVKGERLLGTVVSSYASETMKAKGPVGIALDEVLFVSLMTSSKVANAPNPEGAELFIEFLQSQKAAELIVKYGWFSPRTDVGGPFGFPPADQIKVRHATVPSPQPRQEMLDRFNAIAQAARQ